MMNNRIVYLSLVAIAFLLSSCSNIVFETAQPKHENVLISTTNELQGTWVGEEGDELKISTDWIKTPEAKYELGEDCLLKASNGRYFLSFGEKGAWSLVFAEVTGDRMVVSQFDVQTEEEFALLSEFTKVKMINEDSEYDPKVLINPSVEEFERLLASDLKEELGVFIRK